MHEPPLLPLMDQPVRRAGPPTHHVPDPEHEDGPDDGDQDAPQVETGDADGADGPEEPPSDDGPDDAEEDVQRDPLAVAFDDEAGDEARDQPDADPSQYRGDHDGTP